MDEGGQAGAPPSGPPPGAAAPGPRRAPPVVGGGSNAVQIADEVTDKLAILDYQSDFCARKDQTPFSRTYFALPSPNAGMQFSDFLELVIWLMRRCEHEFTTDKYDDPNTTTNKMMLELKSMGFEMDFPAMKLKQAHGEAVCRVLSFLCDQALALQGFHWSKPSYPEEDFAEEAEVDEEAEVVGDVEDDVAGVEEEEVMYEEIVRGEGKEEEDEHREALVATVDPIAWRTELERVAPLLKSSGIASGGKEWRAHLEQTTHHEKTINEVLPDAAGVLRKISSEVGDMLERLVSKEKYINSHFDHLADEYRVEQERLKAATEQYQESSQAVNGLTSELSVVQDSLEEVKGSMDDRGNSMTDTSPLVRIKAALTKIKADIKTMDLRIGVVGHTLMQAKMRSKADGGEEVDTSRGDDDGEFFDDDDGDDF